METQSGDHSIATAEAEQGLELRRPYLDQRPKGGFLSRTRHATSPHALSHGSLMWEADTVAANPAVARFTQAPRRRCPIPALRMLIHTEDDP